MIDGPYAPMKSMKVGDVTSMDPKTQKEFDKNNRKNIKKSHKAKKLLVCTIDPDEYYRISAHESTKEIWKYV